MPKWACSSSAECLVTRHQTPGLKPAFGRDTLDGFAGVSTDVSENQAMALGAGAGCFLVLLAEVGRSMVELVTEEGEEEAGRSGAVEVRVWQ